MTILCIIQQKPTQSAEQFAKHVDEYAQRNRVLLLNNPQYKRNISSIINNVKKNGDSAIYRYEKKFGGLKSSTVQLRLSYDEIQSAYDEISDAQHTSLKNAAKQLRKTETVTMKMLCKDIVVKNTKQPTTSITRKFVPLASVGCYIPGGLARYPSSAIMSIIPAAVAKVPRIVAVSPVSSSTGKIDASSIVAADMCGATEIYRIGGAHAIAALAYGTASVARVDKIIGPGGAYVTAAKSLVSADVGIDMLAGPTELGIVADSGASVKFIVLDLISQSEHSKDTQCYLITTSKSLAKNVNCMLDKITAMPTLQRADIIKHSLANNGFVALVKDEQSAIAVANRLSAEHLQIMTKNPTRIAELITTPGMILCGEQAPSAASDYMLGSNHVLPTGRQGISRGSLSVLDFVKMLTLVESSNNVLREIQHDTKTLTDAEGLYNHYKAVHSRIE